MLSHVSVFLFFYGQIISHCMHIPHFIYPFISWWTFGLFPLFGCYEWCWYKHFRISFCVDICFYFSWIYILRVKLLCYMVTLFNFWGTANLFSKAAAPDNIPQQHIRVPIPSHYHQHLLSDFLILAILVVMKWYLTVVLICISLMNNDVEHFFKCLLAICISFWEKYPFRYLDHFYIGLFLFFIF